jgi:hypothetical protein
MPITILGSFDREIAERNMRQNGVHRGGSKNLRRQPGAQQVGFSQEESQSFSQDKYSGKKLSSARDDKPTLNDGKGYNKSLSDINVPSPKIN